jgi:hypothetical protein
MIERIFSPLLEIREVNIAVFDINGSLILKKGFEGIEVFSLLKTMKSFFESLSRENIFSEEVKLGNPTVEILLIYLFGRKIMIYYPKIKAKSVFSITQNLKLQLSNLWKAQETAGLKVMITDLTPSLLHNEAQMDEDTIKNIEKFYKIHLKKVEIENLSGKSWIFDLKKGKELKDKILLSGQAIKLLDLKPGDPVIVKPFIESATEKFFG